MLLLLLLLLLVCVAAACDQHSNTLCRQTGCGGTAHTAGCSRPRVMTPEYQLALCARAHQSTGVHRWYQQHLRLLAGRRDSFGHAVRVVVCTWCCGRTRVLSAGTQHSTAQHNMCPMLCCALAMACV
jgi:hypothetical protein